MPEQTSSLDSVHFMKQALLLGESARLRTPPNPWVGCVIVKDQKIIGEGSTLPPGQSHAEVIALQNAGNNAKDADLYVTLEPCCHFGRTPPCHQAIIKAGIKRVFIALEDPDLRVAGKGIQALKEAGIQVIPGLCESEAEESLKPYLHQRRTQRPYTIIKAAISLDGRIAAQDGTSQWISSKEARVNAHELRAQSQAILIGSQTAIVDRPSLTVRLDHFSPLNPPLRVVVDSRGRLSPVGPLFDMKLAPTLIFSSPLASSKRIAEWKETGAEVAILKIEGESVNLGQVLDDLGKRGILQLLAEGGSSLHSSLISQSLFQQLTLYSGPLLLGSTGSPFYTDCMETLLQAPRFKLKHCQSLGDSVRCDYSPILVTHL